MIWTTPIVPATGAAFHRNWLPRITLVLPLTLLLVSHPIIPAQEPLSFQQLGKEFEKPILPILQRYCVGCHAGDEPKGDVDLERLKSISDVRRNPRLWQDVLFMLDNEQMPPPKRDQPSSHEAKSLRSWVRHYLNAEAHANAGDPGPVVMRRLSRTELENTLRDLTGFDLQPTRQFPADNAAGEGFTNAGEAMVMSPALFDKYAAAMRKISAHAVLLPDRIRFAQSPHGRDWEQQRFREIQQIYQRYTSPGGLLALEPYLVGTLRWRETANDQQTSLHEFAKQLGLSPRYLQRLWTALNVPAAPLPEETKPRQSDSNKDTNAVYLMDQLRLKWQQATSQDYGELLSWINRWREQMWSIDPLTISWYGRWQTAKPTLLPRQTIRWKIQKKKGDTTLFLIATPGQGHKTARVQWHDPRFEQSGKPTILLREVLPGLNYSGDNQTDLVTSAPARIELTLSTDQVAGYDFVVDVTLAENNVDSELVHARIEARTAHWEDRAYPRAVEFHGKPQVITDAIHDRPAIRFAKNAYAMLGDSAQLRLATFTITAVVKYVEGQGGPARSIYNNYDNPINWGKGVSLQLMESGVVYFFTTAGTPESYGQLYSTERLRPGFHIITVTYTPEDKRIYANGKLIGAGKSKGLDYGSGTKAAIGALREFGQDFEGDIAEVAVFPGVDTSRRTTFESALGQKYMIDVVSADGQAEPSDKNGASAPAALWFSADRFVPAERYTPSLVPTSLPPLIGAPASRLFQRFDRQQRAFRELLPRGLCFDAITPLNPGQITLRVYYREDEWLDRLMLAPEERTRLNRAWDELHYIGKDARREHESFDVFLGFTTQVSKEQTAQFEAFREPIRQRAAAFEQQLLDSQSHHWRSLLEFARQAWRRPLETDEKKALRKFYDALRQDAVSHEAAVRIVLSRILVSPHFLYRIERTQAGKRDTLLSQWELASRLSYFLWSSMPDNLLRDSTAFLLADRGLNGDQNLDDGASEELVRQTHRMLRDHRVRGLATEFACQWLDLHDFPSYNAKSETQYPMFVDLRGDMYEEVVQFFQDLFRRNGSVLEILDSDHTFVNTALAKHYGWREFTGEGWRRWDGIRKYSRGGVIAMAAVLSKQAGATRTSPVLRGNWIVETLLGEKLPDPPATVPELPDAANRNGLTVRESTERHVSNPTCANCHLRIDPFGFALESFDAIGRLRDKDLIGKSVDTRVRLPDGTEFTGLDGLRRYLLSQRRDDFVRQFCKKLIGFALGRSVQLSDKPLIDEMRDQLAANDYRIWSAVETLIRSRQFLYHRGLEATRPVKVENR